MHLPLGSVTLLAGCALLVGLYWRLGLRPVWAALADVHPSILLVYLAAAVVVRLGYSLRWRLVAQHLGPVPPLSAFVAARLAGDAISSLAPVGRVGGDPVRIGLLYGEGVGGTQASAGVVIDRIIEVLGNSVAVVAYVTVCAVAYAGVPGGHTALAVLGALVLPVGALLVLLVQWHHATRPLAAITGAIGLLLRPRFARGLVAVRQTEDDLVRVCSTHPAVLLWGLAASVLIEVIVVVEHYSLFRAFGLSLDLPTLLVVIMATGLSRAAPVPAGVGTMEATQVAVVTAISGRPDLGLVVATLLRLHETFWLAVGVVALSFQGVSIARVRALWWTSRAPA